MKPWMRIKLTGPHAEGRYFLIDKEDLEFVKRHTWFLTAFGYVATCIYSPLKDKKGNKVYRNKTYFLHRLLNRTIGFYVTDHINGNPLDNRKSNLRSVSQKENCQNRRKRKDNSSGYPGVKYEKKSRAWVATFGKKYLGMRKTKKEAHALRLEAVREAREKVKSYADSEADV